MHDDDAVDIVCPCIRQLSPLWNKRYEGKALEGPCRRFVTGNIGDIR